MKNGIVLGVISLLIIGCSSPSDSPSEYPSTFTVWVINSLGETLSKVDLSTGQVTVNCITLDSSPNDIVIDGELAYVVNSLSNNVQIIDLTTEQTVGTIEIAMGVNPYYLVLENSDRGFVSNIMSGNVSVLDLNACTEVDTLYLGGAPEGLCVAQDRLFITDINYFGSQDPGHLYAYSLSTLELEGEVTVGVNPQIVREGPDSNLHVVCTGDFASIFGEVVIVDPLAMTVEQNIPIGGSPGSLAFDRQNIAYLGSVAWAGEGLILSYDGLTYQIIHGEQNPIVLPSSAMDVAMGSSDHIFAVCFNTDQLIELDGDGNILRSFQVGLGPVTLAVQEAAATTSPMP